MAKRASDEVSGEMVKRFAGPLARAAASVKRFERALCGGLPPWIPEETRKRVHNIYIDASALGFTDRQLISQVRRCESPRFQIPGLAPDGVAFLHNLYFLRHVAIAVSLGPERGLAFIAGEDAALGWRTRRRQQKFAKSGQGRSQTEQRAPEWERWRAKAREISRRTPGLSMSALALHVKRALALDESPHTIRRRLRDI